MSTAVRVLVVGRPWVCGVLVRGLAERGFTVTAVATGATAPRRIAVEFVQVLCPGAGRGSNPAPRGGHHRRRRTVACRSPQLRFGGPGSRGPCHGDNRDGHREIVGLDGESLLHHRHRCRLRARCRPASAPRAARAARRGRTARAPGMSLACKSTAPEVGSVWTTAMLVRRNPIIEGGTSRVRTEEPVVVRSTLRGHPDR